MPREGLLDRLNPFVGVDFAWEALPVTVQYDAGYPDIPDDVVGATLRLITQRFFSRGRDPYLKQETSPAVGEKIYWVGGPPKSGSLPEEIAGLIDPYRVPVVT